MPFDRSTYGHNGSEVDDRPGPFDIEHEDVVLARVVDATVPIQPQGSGAPSAVADPPTMVQPPPCADPWVPAVQQGVPSPADAHAAAYEAGDAYGQYPDAVEGLADRSAPPDRSPVGLRSAVTDGQQWAASPAAGRRRRMPAFTMARRGFEPVEVEAYLTEQDEAIAAAVERADTAERQLAEALVQLSTARDRVAALEDEQRSEPPSSIQALGARVADILQRAWDAAEEVRAEAATAAARTQSEVDEVVRAAQAEARAKAADIVAEAERHRRVVMEELSSRRAEHDADVARLTAERRTAMAELERLHGVLQRALGPQPASTSDSQPGAPSAGSPALVGGPEAGDVTGAAAGGAALPVPPAAGTETVRDADAPAATTPAVAGAPAASVPATAAATGAENFGDAEPAGRAAPDAPASDAPASDAPASDVAADDAAAARVGPSDDGSMARRSEGAGGDMAFHGLVLGERPGESPFRSGTDESPAPPLFD